MRPFFARKKLKLTIPLFHNKKKYIEHTNLSNIKFCIISLSEKGYGTINELNKMKLIDILDILEFEQIKKLH